MKTSGHWFCEHCDDVIFLGQVRLAPRSPDSPAKCPVCNHRSVIWISHAEIRRPVSDESARAWFAHMREVVDAAPDAIPLSK